jgi:hypothetical protein
MSGTPYTAGPFSVDVVGGVERNIELNVPWRATIKAFVFNQVGGVAADCVFELYTKREVAAPTGSSSSSSQSPSPDPAMYSVFGEKSFTAGTPLAEYDKTYPYVNQDSKATDPTRKLYLRILPADSGNKTYELALTMLTSQLG